jgi:hypothetical protein
MVNKISKPKIALMKTSEWIGIGVAILIAVLVISVFK